MFFTRTQKYQFPVPQEAFRSRLIGNHLTIHDLDFEVYDNGHKITIVPHTENIKDLKTLPITYVAMQDDGNDTRITITSKMRKIDYGGPLLIVFFCVFLFVAGIILFFVGGEPQISYTMLALCTLVFTIFWVRLEMGYFDYVRKIRNYIKSIV